MPLNYGASERQELADLLLGCRVDRAAALPTTGTTALFTITGGRVLLVNFLGESTFLNNGSLTIRIQALTTDVTAVQTFMTTAATDANTDPAGTFYTLPAAAGSALVKSTNNSAAVSNTQLGWVLKTGALNGIFVGTPGTGTIKWSAWYIPLDDGAYVTAA